jgi:lipopolysaccharide/colanic/teichoic acid biosynthesis glycosyltransferase
MHMISYDQIKRMLDVMVSSIALACLMPIMLIVAAWVKLDGGPCFYAHERVGLRGKPFKCYKFRSMKPHSDQVLQDYLQQNPDAAAQWHLSRKLTHDPRVTAIGKWIRKLSVDELPQLWNVIKGDMAIVGPRPVTRDELINYYHFYADCYASVRPGITGLWQVSGRSNISYDRRVQLDMQYVHNVNWRMDTDIMMRTPWAVLKSRGAC